MVYFRPIGQPRWELWTWGDRDVLSLCGASIMIYSETRAGWWHDKAVGFLIAAFMNKNLQFTNLDAQVHIEEFKS